jgi:hypothetical protein
VTRYAVDEQRGELLAVWPTGGGDLAHAIATLPAAHPAEDYQAVALGMTRLSQAAWRTYTHPATADGLDPDTGGRPEREDFADVLDAIRQPYLPHDGLLVQPYSTLAALAHALGRTLRHLDERALTDAVALDVQRELEAVEQADLGDLTGRARQAVTLTRADASPLQVAEADRLLREDPFGDMRLFTDLDPTAAAVAAAHWLKAAADVTAQATNDEPDNVILASDQIQSVPYLTPTVILQLIGNGLTPRTAVTALVREAMTAASGAVPDPAGLADVLADALGQPPGPGPAPQVRTTPLDPARPALDLLEDLLAAIRACWILHRQHDPTVTDTPDSADAGPLGSGPAVESRSAGPAIAGDPEDPQQTWPDIPHFLDLVRAEAAARADRLI